MAGSWFIYWLGGLGLYTGWGLWQLWVLAGAKPQVGLYWTWKNVPIYTWEHCHTYIAPESFWCVTINSPWVIYLSKACLEIYGVGVWTFHVISISWGRLHKLALQFGCIYFVYTCTCEASAYFSPCIKRLHSACSPMYGMHPAAGLVLVLTGFCLVTGLSTVVQTKKILGTHHTVCGTCCT